jgi:Zn-dependent M28 family amino/carboxypeptidase
MKILVAGLVALFAVSSARAQQHPRDGQIDNADTLAWWHTTEDLSNDAMEGRDTGTAAYQRAAEYVAKRFEAAGLKPAGENGTYFQVVPMHEIDTLVKGTSFVVERKGGALKLEFLQEITATWTPEALKSGEGELTFRGYCGKDAMADIAGKIVVCFGTQRMGLPSGAERARNAREGGAKGIVNVDDPYFSIEPPRWPYAYARSVTLKDPAVKERAAGTPTMLPAMRISAEAFAKLLQGSGQDAGAVLQSGGAKKPLASFEIPGKMVVKMEAMEKEISSPNVLAVWPGNDAAVGDEMVVAGAHLDGYGYGTPVKGDGLYNGTLDDAAYVALLIQMADDLHAGVVKKGGLQQAAYAPGVIVDKGMSLAATKRSILFAVFTGEEKGLLGSNWFVGHPTVAKEKLVADVNLDQLRPLFPLNILTAEAVNDTTLGATAREVGAGMGVEIREDKEPERGLLRRADQFPFLRMGVPAISFIFGYDPGTDAEKRYREWYQVRYHRPQDDLTQPMDFHAATRFDVFFYRLIETIANGEKKPEFLPGSSLEPKK